MKTKGYSPKKYNKPYKGKKYNKRRKEDIASTTLDKVMSIFRYILSYVVSLQLGLTLLYIPNG